MVILIEETRGVQYIVDQLVLVVAFEWKKATEQAVQDGPTTPNVALFIVCFSPEDLWSHVLDRAAKSFERSLTWGEGRCKAEVAELDGAHRERTLRLDDQDIF